MRNCGEIAGNTKISHLHNNNITPDTCHNERVIKRFYERFKVEHQRFLTFIEGIAVPADREWYASLMLNRLMFVYFIQRKGFLATQSVNKLDGDIHYLPNRLRMMQEHYGWDGQNTHHSFYRYFLLRLFHDGLGKREHSDELEKVLGKVPYLNGSLFAVHALERDNPSISIADEAFAKLFAFFDEFQWHLDDRPLQHDNEINPDVLGYIFEKYINQKQMGAYYTKEDITDYISKNTIIPYLFTATEQKCLMAFAANGPVWSLLRDNPDRYLYPAIKKGCELPLPAEIAVGIDDVTQRTVWNKAAPATYALPTESWREVVARRRRYAEVLTKLAAGEITSINDFITYNLDIRQFAQSVIEVCEDTDLLRAFYDSIEQVTVLDPTCGSGAFLFAALRILEPLYAACLDRMQTLLAERDLLDAALKTQRRVNRPAINHFREILQQVNRYPNRRYFILKSIILNNLYGVDIMEEATEICKLRLFLKLISQVQHWHDMKLLPDIDFNIRAGNTLVGFATYAEAEKVITSQPDPPMPTRGITCSDAPCGHQGRLHSHLAAEYGIDQNSLPDQEVYEKKFQEWQASHQPFHWFIEFYRILQDGGFDVVIGNPPYVEYSTVRKAYTVTNYQTESCGNVYALVMERCLRITRDHGRNGMIVQLPIVCTDRMLPIQQLLRINSSALWLSNYDDRPAKLFDGLEHIRASIVINEVAQTKPVIWTTTYHRWVTQARETLFQNMSFMHSIDWEYVGAFPKLGHQIEENIVQKLHLYAPLKSHLKKHISNRQTIYFHNTPQYWIRAMTFAPYFWNERDGEQITSHVKSLVFSHQRAANVVVAVMNSSLFYWWFLVLSDCRHLNLREIERFPIGLDVMREEHQQRLAALSQLLMTDYQQHAVRKEATYKTTGKVIYDKFYPRHSKPIIDEIDRVLAQHYGFTNEELDFIINYDIKYRMGKNGEEGEE